MPRNWTEKGGEENGERDWRILPSGKSGRWRTAAKDRVGDLIENTVRQ